jgi:hypothetical protein
VYLDDGFYALLVTVFNADVEYGSDIANLTVTNVPPSIDSLSVSPTDSVQPGDTVECTVTFSDPGILDTHTMTIEWGDGVSAQFSADADTTVISDSHSYSNADDYEIVVSLTDDDGGVDTALMHVVVKSPSTNSTDALKGLIASLKIPRGLKNTLLSVLENIPHLLKHHKIHMVIHQLHAFIHFVQAQNSKKLPRDQAKELIQTAQSIIDALKQP